MKKRNRRETFCMEFGLAWSDLEWYQGRLGLYVDDEYYYFIGKVLTELPKNFRDDMEWIEQTSDFIAQNGWKLWRCSI